MSVDFEELQENGQVNFMEWFQNASEEEKRLADNVARLEPLFDDMRFRPGTVSDTLIVTSCINPDTNEKFENYYDVPDFLDNLSVDCIWRPTTVGFAELNGRGALTSGRQSRRRYAAKGSRYELACDRLSCLGKGRIYAALSLCQ